MRMQSILGLLVGLTCLLPMSGNAERVKDLASIRGVRANQLIGYGIVIGLNGTGDSDKTTFTTQSIVAMLARNNVRVGAAGPGRARLPLRLGPARVLRGQLPDVGRARPVPPEAEAGPQAGREEEVAETQAGRETAETVTWESVVVHY